MLESRSSFTHAAAFNYMSTMIQGTIAFCKVVATPPHLELQRVWEMLLTLQSVVDFSL